MSAAEYLHDGLIAGGALRPELEAWAAATAQEWIEAGVEVGLVEALAELLALWARELEPESKLSAADITDACSPLEPPAAVLELLADAFPRGASVAEVAALAVHLVDIVERMALLIFVPELPNLAAKSDRSGGAARVVGLARHLKG